jgi:hypothetical protein
MKITIKTNQECEKYVDVYINGICKGTVMSDGTITPQEAWDNLKNNWAIDAMEAQNDINIDRNSNY